MRATASAALAKMTHKRYGLVISDWNMEPMTGLTAARDARRSRFGNAVHYGDRGIQNRKRHRREKAGVNNYIVKPFNAQTLKAKIEAVFAAANCLAGAG